MQTEVIKNLKVSLPFAEIRSGKCLTVIELSNQGKLCGRDLTFKTNEELSMLIDGLQRVREFWIKEKS